VAEQALLMKMLRLSDHDQQIMLNKLTLWFKRKDRLLLLIQPTRWISAVDMHITSSTRTCVTTSVQGGCQSS